jgi:subtilisin family serine protease
MAFIENSLVNSTALNLPATPIADGLGTTNLLDPDRFTLTQSRQVDQSLGGLSPELQNDAIGSNLISEGSAAGQEQVSRSALASDGFFDVRNGVYASAAADDQGFDYPGKIKMLTMEEIIKSGTLKGSAQPPELIRFIDNISKPLKTVVTDIVLPGLDGVKREPYTRLAPGTGIDGNIPIKSGENRGNFIAPATPADPDALIGGPGGTRYSDLVKSNKQDKPGPFYTPEEAEALFRKGDIAYTSGFPASDRVVGIADFNKDGQKDLLLRNQTTGEMQFWYMNGTNKIGEAPYVGAIPGMQVIPPSNWVIEGVGDFNSDGFSDIVWRESNTNSVVVWHLNNNQGIGGATMTYNGSAISVASGFRIDAVTDGNNDGKLDLLWRNYNDGTTAYWYGTGGFNFVGGALIGVLTGGNPNTPPTYVSPLFSLEGTGDWNGDGVQDMFWRDSANNLIYWQMNPANAAGHQFPNLSASAIIGTATPGAVVTQVGDLNGDNRPDVVWKMANGQHVVWTLTPDSSGKPSIGPASGFLASNNTSPNATYVATNFNSEFGYGMADVSAAIALLKNQVQPLEQVDTLAVNTLSNNSRQNEILNLPEVWNQGYTGQGVTVAVIDNGVMLNHPDLDANIWVNTGEIAGDGIDNDNNGFIDDRNGWDFFQNDNNPSPSLPNNISTNNHGTEVAGMIAAEAAANGADITGGAFNAKIMALRAGVDNSISLASAAQSVKYAADMGAKVINLSFGGSYIPSNTFQTNFATQVNYAVSKGAVVVISAGNGGSDTINTVFPAILAGTPGVIAVGATNAGSFGVSSSNAASQVTTFSTGAGGTVRNYVMAPGFNIQTTTRDSAGNSGFGLQAGTSFSAPLVAAAIATIRQAVPGATPADITNALAQSADPSDIYI